MFDVVGTDRDGTPIHRVQIQNGLLTANILSLGASLQSLFFDGFRHSMVLGYDNIDSYASNPNLFGAIVGRYANRIANARASVDGKVCHLDNNFLDKHHIHGGRNGSSFRNWTVEDCAGSWVRFADRLPHGHMGFPGNLDVSVLYRLTSDNELCLEIEATADSATLCNFTGHSYFNLDGHPDLSHHWLRIAAKRYVATNNQGIPIENSVRPVSKMLDYQSSRPLIENGEIADVDTNYCLSNERTAPRAAAQLYSQKSGVSLELSTTEPGLQVYTAGGLVSLPSPEQQFHRHAGVALEPQVWPDAPNQKDFPNSTLLPGEVYQHSSTFTFRHFAP